MSHYLTARARREAGSNPSTSAEDAGAELAAGLIDWIGMAPGITATCIKLVKAAREHTDWQIISLNRPLTAAEDDREEEVSRLLDQLAGQLPETDDGEWTVDLSGDPRGCTVALLAPEHTGHHDGIAVA